MRRQCEPRKPLRDGRYVEDRKDRRVAPGEQVARVDMAAGARSSYQVRVLVT